MPAAARRKTDANAAMVARSSSDLTSGYSDQRGRAERGRERAGWVQGTFVRTATTPLDRGGHHPNGPGRDPDLDPWADAAASVRPPVSASPPASESPTPDPVVSTPPADLPATTVIDAATPARLSVSVSRALFASSPVVVTASVTDPAGVASGAHEAELIGVPLLLTHHNDAAPAGAMPTAQVLADELTRLGATSVLAMGASAAEVAAADPGVQVVTTAADAHGVAVANAGAPTVLVQNGAGAGSVIAADATATAHAAGDIVVGFRGADPRADANAIAALAKNPPTTVLAVGGAFGPPDRLAARIAVAGTGTMLPGGGQLFFPGRRLLALYGHPGGAGLGVLGAQDLPSSIARAQQMAATYQPLSTVPVVPTFEIIATVAQAAAGDDGNYSAESSVASLLPWVQQASAAGLYVVLDLQPGSADVLAQAKLYTSLLQLPNVGLAIDPEWALAPGELPLHQIGSIDTAQINAVGEWLEQLTAAGHLPQKLFVLHQFRLSMIGHESALKTSYDDVAVLIHMDGQGGTPSKIATWTTVVHTAPKGVPFGWKNFYKEDHPTMTPEQTMAQHPTPVMISYQ